MYTTKSERKIGNTSERMALSLLICITANKQEDLYQHDSSVHALASKTNRTLNESSTSPS